MTIIMKRLNKEKIEQGIRYYQPEQRVEIMMYIYFSNF